MGLREAVQNRPGLVTTVAVAVIVVAIGWAAYQLWPVGELRATNQLFFTVDDGKTWFSASADNIPPFMHEGKPACQAFVWTSDGGKTQFVSHLFRYTPSGRARVLQQQKAGPAAPPSLPGSGLAESEVKRPGEPESAWIRSTDPRAGAITIPQSAAGAEITQVFP